MGRFSENQYPMGWDGTEDFENRPIPWDDFFLNIPSHPMGQKLSVKILDLLIY